MYSAAPLSDGLDPQVVVFGDSIDGSAEAVENFTATRHGNGDCEKKMLTCKTGISQ
jgi:hypothetical protein